MAKDYIIVSALTKEQLETEVKLLLLDKWQPLGNPILRHLTHQDDKWDKFAHNPSHPARLWYQAMIK